MIVKIMGRATGKTTELIRLSHATGFHIVASNLTRARFISDLAERLNIDIPDVFTAHGIIRQHIMHGLSERRILIDDLDSVINELFRTSGAEPIAASMGIDHIDVAVQKDIYNEFVSDDSDRLMIRKKRRLKGGERRCRK